MDFVDLIPFIALILALIFVIPLAIGENEAKEILCINGGAPIIHKTLNFGKNADGYHITEGVITVKINVKYLFWNRTVKKSFNVTDEIYNSYDIGDFFYISDLSI